MMFVFHLKLNLFNYLCFSDSSYQSALNKSAHSELSAPIRVLTGLDDSRLDCLLELTVTKTGQWTIEQLQRLYSQFASSIYHHRKEHDKSILIEVNR